MGGNRTIKDDKVVKQAQANTHTHLVELFVALHCSLGRALENPEEDPPPKSMPAFKEWKDSEL